MRALLEPKKEIEELMKKLIMYQPSPLNDLIYMRIEPYIELLSTSELVVREPYDPDHRIKFQGRFYLSIRTLVYLLVNGKRPVGRIHTLSNTPNSIDPRSLFTMNDLDNETLISEGKK